VGYAPSFYSNDFNTLIEKNGAENIALKVIKNNTDAPPHNSNSYVNLEPNGVKIFNLSHKKRIS